MTDKIKLTKSEITKSLAGLPGWAVKNDKLHKEFNFESFAEAFAFMTKVALSSEKMDHHPEWFNVYNKVIIDLKTHDFDAISSYDIELASQIENLSHK